MDAQKFVMGLRSKADGETIEAYVCFIESRLAREDVSLADLEALCRRYVVGVDELSFKIAAEKTGAPAQWIKEDVHEAEVEDEED